MRTKPRERRKNLTHFFRAGALCSEIWFQVDFFLLRFDDFSVFLRIKCHNVVTFMDGHFKISQTPQHDERVTYTQPSTKYCPIIPCLCQSVSFCVTLCVWMSPCVSLSISECFLVCHFICPSVRFFYFIIYVTSCVLKSHWVFMCESVSATQQVSM